MSKAKKQNIKPTAVMKKISSSLNKKGKIRGKNNQETELLQNMCPHHRITKKGKVESAIRGNQASGELRCSMCGDIILDGLYSKKEVKHAVEELASIFSQSRYLAVNAGIDNESQEYLNNISVGIQKFPKIYKRLSKVYEKQSQNKNKNKNNKKNSNSSSYYGSWETKF